MGSSDGGFPAEVPSILSYHFLWDTVQSVPPGLGTAVAGGFVSPEPWVPHPLCLSLPFSSILRMVKVPQHLDLCITTVNVCRAGKEQVYSQRIGDPIPSMCYNSFYCIYK